MMAFEPYQTNPYAESGLRSMPKPLINMVCTYIKEVIDGDYTSRENMAKSLLQDWLTLH